MPGTSPSPTRPTDAGSSSPSRSPRTFRASWTVSGPGDHGSGVLELLEGVADQPEHRGPEADEQGPAFGVVAVVLVDGLGPDPEAEAEGDRAERRRLQVRAAQAGGVQRLDQHGVSFSFVSGATAGVDHHEKEKHGSGSE